MTRTQVLKGMCCLEKTEILVNVLGIAVNINDVIDCKEIRKDSMGKTESLEVKINLGK